MNMHKTVSKYLKFYHRFYSISPFAWVQLLAGALLQSLTVFFIVFSVNQVINTQIPEADTNGLTQSVSIILLGTCLITFMTLAMQKVALKETKRGSTQFREYLTRRSFQLSKSFRDRNPISKLHHVFVQDTNRIDEANLAFLMDFVPSMITTISINLILLILNWKLYLLLIATVPCLILVSALMNKKLGLSIKRYHSTIEFFSDHILHLFQTVDLIHIQCAVKSETEHQKEIIERLQGDFYRTNWLKTLYISTQNLVVTLSALIILGIGGYSVINGMMNLGSLISFYVGVGILKRYMMSLTSSYEKILTGYESLKNLLDTLGYEEKELSEKKELVTFNGRISLKNVSFGFDETSLLRDLSLEIEPGSLISVVGSNGSGKTTLINLILGFYEPTKGEILANSIPYDQIDIEKLRREIGVVTQTPLIRTGTIMENISFGNPDATFDEVREAAFLSTAAEFIEKLPKNYKTHVGPNGMKLSGGEKQRISIARALLGKPKILIFDEPTNHLDRSSIDGLFNQVLKSSHSPAILCISHNQDLIARSTTVVDFSRRGECIRS